MGAGRQQIQGDMVPETPTNNSGAIPGVDLRMYWRVFKKHKWIILATVALVTGGFIAYTMHQTKMYQAVATVIIDPVAPKVLPSQDVVELGTGSTWDNHEYYNTQMRILKSHRLARDVVLNEKNKRFLHDVRIVGEWEKNPKLTEDDLVELAASYIEGGLRVLPVRDSRVFGVGFMDKDKDLAADIANAVSKEYIAQNVKVKTDQTKDATRWVATQLDKARGELDKTESALYLYKKDNNILSVNLEERQNLIARDLDEYSHALTDANKKRIDLQARRRALLGIIDKGGDATDAPSSYVVDAPAVTSLRATYREERRKLDTLREKYGPEWPEVKLQQARVDAALEDLRQEGLGLVRAIDAEISALEEDEARYAEQLKRLKADALDLNQHEVDYKKLSVAATGAEQAYVSLLKRYHESNTQEADVANNIRPLDDAVAPDAPSEPRMKQAIVFGVALGIVLALVLAFIVEVLDRTVKSQEDVEATVGLPFLGIVPSVALAGAARGQAKGKSDREHHVIYHPTSAAAECCRVVRTNIMFCSPDKPLKNLLVTSSNPVEGKTMNVVNLGVVMAQGGARTLIVDTDMRRPRLHKILGTSNEHGVSRVILEPHELDAAIKTTEVPNLFLLPCGPVPPNPAELLQTEKFAALVRALGDRFDRILFDSPPVLAVTDAAILSRVVDGAVMVVRAGRTTRDALIRARNHLGAVNASIVGVVLNDVDLKNPHYAEYYGYTSKYYGVSPAKAR
jgi:capsular exopolysaccharide synthesis family protein